MCLIKILSIDKPGQGLPVTKNKEGGGLNKAGGGAAGGGMWDLVQYMSFDMMNS